ncbi:MAG: MATE family efflux transporter [Lachnospiraceae bacterium]|nr:MATE family efflux transporter [Lachnospiraceae bacterium]
MNTNIRRRWSENRDLYKYALLIALPMIGQNMITNFVSLLDNIMVGQIGTTSMSGVSIVNQLIFVFNLTIFGGVSGAGIFGTQFFGKGDHEGQKYTVRFRILLVLVLTAIGFAISDIWGEQLISFFLTEEDAPALTAATLQYGLDYLAIMKWSLIPFAIGQAYASAVRECGETRIPMYGSLAAIGINLFLDYALIFGTFGFPKMGVQGAAIATVIAKIVEAVVIIGWAHLHPQKNKYLIGLYRGFRIPGDLAKRIFIKGSPLLFNEFLWSFGMSVIAQLFSLRGLDVVAARNIASTLTNMFNVIFIQFGAAIGIIIGMRLGAGKFEQAKREAHELIIFITLFNVVLALVMLPVAYLFPMVYNTEAAIRSLAAFYIVVQALAMPLCCYSNACYFLLRSGGRTGMTFLFDFCFTWFLMIPLTFVLVKMTSVDIHIIMAVVTFTEIFKSLIGRAMIRSGIWVRNIVDA